LRNQKKLVLCVFLLSFSFIILGNAIDLQSERKFSQLPRLSTFSGVSVGDAWTYVTTFDNETIYMSYKVTSVSDTAVMANEYKNGVFTHNYNIYGVWIVIDEVAELFSNSPDTYSATYGGRQITVYESDYFIVDITTGIHVEILGMELYSWDVYKSGGGNSVSGYELITFLSVSTLLTIGIISLFLKKYSKS